MQSKYDEVTLIAEYQRFKDEAEKWNRQMRTYRTTNDDYTHAAIINSRYNANIRGAAAMRQFIWLKFGTDVNPLAAQSLGERLEMMYV